MWVLVGLWLMFVAFGMLFCAYKADLDYVVWFVVLAVISGLLIAAVYSILIGLGVTQ